MARLIDADALMEIYARYEFTSDMGDAMEILDNAPTVDAIPVEYILKQIVKLERSKGQSYHAICYRHLIEVWRYDETSV